jgi:hypothetical protein
MRLLNHDSQRFERVQGAVGEGSAVLEEARRATKKIAAKTKKAPVSRGFSVLMATPT